MPSPAPSVQRDLFSEPSMAQPYELYRELRELGPVVHFEIHDFLALTRHRDVCAAGSDHADYSSADGIALLDTVSQQLRGTVLASDPPEHSALRAVLRCARGPHLLLARRSARPRRLCESRAEQGRRPRARQLRVWKLNHVASGRTDFVHPLRHFCAKPLGLRAGPPVVLATLEPNQLTARGVHECRVHRVGVRRQRDVVCRAVNDPDGNLHRCSMLEQADVSHAR